MTGLSVGYALAAAVAFAWSAAAMHHATWGAPDTACTPWSLLRHVCRQWRWATGMAASLLGLGLHAAALSAGSLAVVQPLLAGGLVLALFFRAVLDHRRPSHRELLWSLAVGVSLAGFLLLAGSTTGTAKVSGSTGGWVLGGGAAVAACCFWGSHVMSSTASDGPLPHKAGVLLGAGTGVVFGLIGGTLKAVTGEAGLVAAFTSWPLWCLIGLGVAGFFANQTTYRKATLTQSLPVINVMNPLVSLLFGVIAFSEWPTGGWLAHVSELVALALTLGCVYHLTQLETEPAGPIETAGTTEASPNLPRVPALLR